MPDFTNKKKTALVTGAAGSLGIATARALLKDGHDVILMDINQERLNDLQKELPGKTYAMACNLADPEDVDRAYKLIEETIGDVDILVNNAGILSNNKAEATTVSEWQKVMAVNLDGVFFLSRLVMGGMKKKGWGRIINTSSLAAKTGGITAGTAYSTSKGAIMSLTFSLAAELAAFGVTVNGIAPAYVRTPMVMEQLTEEQRAKIIEKIPVKRFCEPEEFAHVVSFLVNPLAGFITGEIIDQNGGLIFD